MELTTLAGEQGLEPRVTVLGTVGLPLTDSPISPLFVSVGKGKVTKPTSVPLRLEYGLNQLIRNQPLVEVTGFEPASSPHPKCGGVAKLPNTSL